MPIPSSSTSLTLSPAKIPILFKRYPSSLPSLCNELVFPDTPLASVLRRPVPIYVLALRELRQRVLPSQDWPPPASPAPDRLPIQNTPRPSPILASCHVSRPSPLPAPLFLHPVHDARLSCCILEPIGCAPISPQLHNKLFHVRRNQANSIASCVAIRQND